MRRWTNVLLAVLLLSAAASGGEQPEEEFAGWPQRWVDTYRRFEKFIAEQYANVPGSDLHISSEGQIQTSLPTEVNGERHTSIVFYGGGANLFEMTVGGGLFNERRERFLRPGTYATCLKTSDELLGYQFRHPLMWFQVNHSRFGEEANIRTDGPLSVEMIAQPEPAADFWPNDRLLRYWDFQVLPHINPLQFFRENRKTSPNVTLAVTNVGLVQREKLDDSLESLLRWRIYFDGRLIEKGPAAGDLQHAVTRGMGSYVVFVGVDGPNGFMPVSNLLQFPLFPERDGSLAVCPSTTQETGVPDCLFDALAPDQMNILRRSIGWRARPDPYDASTIYCLSEIGTLPDPQKQAVLSLWTAWGWSVNLAKANPAAEIGRIHMVSGGDKK